MGTPSGDCGETDPLFDGPDSHTATGQTYINGVGWQDPPDERPLRNAADSIGRRQQYPPDGYKR